MRRVFVTVVLLAIVVAGCGSYGDGKDADVEKSVASSIGQQLETDAPLVTVRSVECSGQRPRLACDVQLGVGNTIVSVDYQVDVGSDGCWTAKALEVRVSGAGAETNSLRDVSGASDLTGCLA